MRKIVAILMVLCLATAFIGCSSNTSIDGKWYKHGNLRDNCLQISEDNTWKLYQPENGNLTLITEGTVENDKGQLGFKETMSHTTYYSDTSKDEIRYIWVSYYRAEDSVDGFEAYNGKWYRGGDINNDFLKIEDGEWKYWESDGITSTSNLNGYLASDGKDDLLAYKHTNEKYCRIGLLTESELRFKGKKYSLINIDMDKDDLTKQSSAEPHTSDLSAWYGFYNNSKGAMFLDKSINEGHIDYDIRIDDTNDNIMGMLLPDGSNRATDDYLEILLDGDTVQVKIKPDYVGPYDIFAGTYKK